MPRQVLVFKVTVESDNPNGDRAYLNKLRDTFRMISEDLVSWGYTGDESFSQSDVYVEKSDAE
jgi:hypothetical protein